MANVLTPAGGIFRRLHGGCLYVKESRHKKDQRRDRRTRSRRWFAWKKAVARRTDDRPAKRMVSATGWREDLMYALREEGDITAAPLLLPLANFYPRPPRGGRPGLSTFWK